MAASSLNLTIVGMSTIVPLEITEPGLSRKLTFAGPLRPETMQSRLRVVLYYRRGNGEESARMLGAWIKESLGVALSRQPGLAGRLRRDGVEEGCWEVKFNDGGVRSVQATAEITMEEVLESKDRDGMEAQLCYWQDVDEENPNYSPLFFIQVTEFRGLGYSIGLSCNLLLVDPLMFTKFLKEWAMIHSQMLAQGKLSKTSIFYLDNLKKPKQSIQKSNHSDSNTTATNTTILFKARQPHRDHTIQFNVLLTRCITEAMMMLEGRMVHEFSLLVSKEDIKVSTYTKDDLNKTDANFDGTINLAWWDEFGLEEMTLTGGKPIHVSYHIVSPIEQGIVLTMPTSSVQEGHSESVVIITVPRKI